MTLPPVNTSKLVEFLVDLLNTPSPTGFTERGIAFTEKALSAFPQLKLRRTRKGALLATWQGECNDSPRALTAHVDTLGAVVKEIKSSGRLKLSQLGNFAWNSVEGEGCTVFTSRGDLVRGSILYEHASTHVYGRQVGEAKRDDESIEVRLDELTNSDDETHLIGIQVGDCVAFDPRVEVTNDFIRSRHLDDKAGVAAIFAAVQGIHAAGLKPIQTTTLLISNYEEVGHGAAVGIPADTAELVAVDLAAIGDGQTSDEYHATLCVKDSGGPYHYALSQRLRELAEEQQIPYKVDVYPNYGSDGEAFWRAGGDVAVALIGPGVDASHNYERTHLDALIGTTQWIMAYLLN
jgi:putative aminopeptidase FrvX